MDLSNKPALAIIIPTLNEEKNILKLIDHLYKCDEKANEIIVVDGGSTDRTAQHAQSKGVHFIQHGYANRAAQLNAGAKVAQSKILYFVHADTLPPKGYCTDIRKALASGYDLGCFRFQFDSNHILLKINAFFTRFNKMWCRGGDQSLFIHKNLFEHLNGFDEEYVLMEDYDIIKRALPNNRFYVIPKNILVSARKYQKNNYLKIQLANALVFNMYNLGVNPETLKRIYYNWIRT